jgi:hypothetical protein
MIRETMAKHFYDIWQANAFNYEFPGSTIDRAVTLPSRALRQCFMYSSSRCMDPSIITINLPKPPSVGKCTQYHTSTNKAQADVNETSYQVKGIRLDHVSLVLF